MRGGGFSAPVIRDDTSRKYVELFPQLKVHVRSANAILAQASSVERGSQHAAAFLPRAPRLDGGPPLPGGAGREPAKAADSRVQGSADGLPYHRANGYVCSNSRLEVERNFLTSNNFDISKNIF